MNFDFYLLLKLTRSRSLEPEPKLRHSGSGQKFRFHAAPAPQHWFIQIMGRARNLFLWDKKIFRQMTYKLADLIHKARSASRPK